MANATSTQLQELYVAYFGRAADPTGLDYWTEKGITTAKFAADMYAQAEFKDAYGSLSTESQVNEIYKNLFDREADVAGLTYWTQQINLGNLQLAEIATHLIWAAQNNAGSSDDKTALSNRTAAAIAYTAEVKTTTAGILAYQAESTDPWKSGVNITEAKTYLSGIDKSTAYTAEGVTASVAKVVAAGIPTASVAGKTIALTKNIDAGSDFVGGSGNDTFSGSAGTIDGDILDGAGGTDTLSVSVTQADDNNSSFKSSNIENVVLRTTNGATTLDLGDVTGMTTLSARRLAANLQLDNVDFAAAVKLENTSTGSLADINFVAASVTGSSDSTTVTLDTNTDVDLDVDSIETLNLKTEVGKSTIGDLTGDKLATINVTGDKGLTISAFTGAGNLVIDGTGNTGGTKVVVPAGDHTFTGGSGVDTIDTGITLTSADTIDGGDGVDVLIVDNTGSAALDAIPAKANVKNVETLRLEATDDSDADAFTVDASIVKFTNFIVDSSDETDTFTFTNVTDETFLLTESDNNAVDLIDVSLKDATGETDSLTLEVKNADAATALTIDDIASTGGGIETLTLNLVQGKDIASASDILVDDISSAHNTLNITGDADATIGRVTAVSPKTIDASAATGDLTISLAAAKHTVTTGSGDDSVDFVATIGSTDTFDGGAGTDTIKATPAAGVHTPTIKNVEKASFTFSTASSINLAKTTGLTQMTFLAASDEDFTVNNIPSTVANTYISGTSMAAGDNINLTYASDSATAHTIRIGDTADAAAVATGDITLTGNKAALTITSEGAANDIDDIHANDATSLTITTDTAFELEAANGAADGNLNATSALFLKVTTTGGKFDVDGATNISKATDVDLNAYNGLILLTGAVTASKATSLDINANGYSAEITGDFVTDADVPVINLIAKSKSGSIRMNGVLDADHVETINASATNGATVTVDDIEMLGVEKSATAADLDTALNITATGTDVDGNGSTATITAIDTAAGATLDLVTIVSDNKGTVSFTSGGANITITKIDASASLGTNTFDTTTIAALTKITAGAAKKNTFTTEANLADEITLAVDGGEDVYKQMTDTTAADKIYNFQAGDGGDTIQIDVSEIDNGILNMAATAQTAANAVQFATDNDGSFVDTENKVLATDNVLVLTNTFASIAAVQAGLDMNAEANVTDMADNDDVLVLWTNGSDSFLSQVKANGADGADFNAGQDLVQLMNTTLTDLTEDNFEFL